MCAAEWRTFIRRNTRTNDLRKITFPFLIVVMKTAQMVARWLELCASIRWTTKEIFFLHFKSNSRVCFFIIIYSTVWSQWKCVSMGLVSAFFHTPKHSESPLSVAKKNLIYSLIWTARLTNKFLFRCSFIIRFYCHYPNWLIAFKHQTLFKFHVFSCVCLNCVYFLVGCFVYFPVKFSWFLFLWLFIYTHIILMHNVSSDASNMQTNGTRKKSQKKCFLSTQYSPPRSIRDSIVLLLLLLLLYNPKCFVCVLQSYWNVSKSLANFS